jgi:hypothetical protein
MHLPLSLALLAAAAPLALASPHLGDRTSTLVAREEAPPPKTPLPPIALADVRTEAKGLTTKNCKGNRRCGGLHGQCKEALERFDDNMAYPNNTHYVATVPGEGYGCMAEYGMLSPPVISIAPCSLLP